MSRLGRRDTAHEKRLRSAVHRRGLRFFVDRPVAPGQRRRPDIVFPRAKVVVYSDGCFWHACPDHMSWPKANAEFWRDKIESNRTRDRDTDAALRQAGWTVLRFWEHEDPEVAADVIAAVIAEKLR